MKPRVLVSALPRLVLAVSAGAVCGVAAALANAPDRGVLSAIAVSGTVFVLLGWWVLWPMDAATTRTSVKHEDFDPLVDELFVMGPRCWVSAASVASYSPAAPMREGSQQP